jgi:hypothetical protein
VAALLDDSIVIVRGGAGERLYPLTKERQARRFGGQYRIIDFALKSSTPGCDGFSSPRVSAVAQPHPHGWSTCRAQRFTNLPPQKRGASTGIRAPPTPYPEPYSIMRENPRFLTSSPITSTR